MPRPVDPRTQHVVLCVVRHVNHVPRFRVRKPVGPLAPGHRQRPECPAVERSFATHCHERVGAEHGVIREAGVALEVRLLDRPQLALDLSEDVHPESLQERLVGHLEREFQRRFDGLRAAAAEERLVPRVARPALVHRPAPKLCEIGGRLDPMVGVGGEEVIGHDLAAKRDPGVVQVLQHGAGTEGGFRPGPSARPPGTHRSMCRGVRRRTDRAGATPGAAPARRPEASWGAIVRATPDAPRASPLSRWRAGS